MTEQEDKEIELSDVENLIKSRLIQIASKQTQLSLAQKAQEALEFVRGVIKNES